MNTIKTSQRLLILVLGILSLSTATSSTKIASEKLFDEEFSNTSPEFQTALVGDMSERRPGKHLEKLS